MGLSAKEKKLLESLQRKAEEPDAGPVGRSVRVNVDLGDPKQYALALRHGLLDALEDDDDDDAGDDDDPKDETPKRRGYFGDEKK